VPYFHIGTSALAKLSSQFQTVGFHANFSLSLTTLRQVFELIWAGTIFKPYPCGASTHAAIDCALVLSKQLPPTMSPKSSV
jgi:2-methylcitrate dehydratase PrpD